MSSNKKKTNLNAYSKYSGVAYQMIAILLVSGWIGGKIDAYFDTVKPYYTAGLMLFMLVTYLWKIVLMTTHDK